MNGVVDVATPNEHCCIVIERVSICPKLLEMCSVTCRLFAFLMGCEFDYLLMQMELVLNRCYVLTWYFP